MTEKNQEGSWCHPWRAPSGTKWPKMASFMVKIQFWKAKKTTGHPESNQNKTYVNQCNPSCPKNGNEGSRGRAWSPLMGSKWSKLQFLWQKSFLWLSKLQIQSWYGLKLVVSNLVHWCMSEKKSWRVMGSSMRGTKWRKIAQNCFIHGENSILKWEKDHRSSRIKLNWNLC